MRLSVGKKLGLSFSALCLTILTVALMAIFVIQSIGNTVLKEKVPLKDVAMEASIALGQGINTAREYILAEDGLPEIEEKMEEATGDFNMFIAMVEHGTESEKFKNSPAGEMYKKDGLTLVVPQGSDELLALTSEIRKIQPVFNEKMMELIKIHPEKVQYYFDFQDVHYDLTSFLYWADVSHERWFEKVKAAVEYETDFSGELDPTKCIVGRWYASYQTDDEELLAKLEEYSAAHTELHNTARTLFNANVDERDSWFSRISRYYSKAKRKLQSVQELSADKLQALTKAEETCIAGVFNATESMQQLLHQFEETADKEMILAQNEADASKQTAITVMTIMLIMGALLGIALGIFVTRSITKPINAIINNLGEGAEQVGSASAQVASASQSLAEGASEQASSLEETSSSLEEMTSMTRQNAENAKQANTLATDASTATDKGMTAMTSMSDAMQEIKQSSDETAKVIKVIDEIAFQTNLLALNAAVEAARAGEAGKGFAVVAEEVRNLAQRSAEAAKETSSLIEGSQKNADNGVKSVEELMEVLKEVAGGIRKVADLLAEVTAASDEQAQGIEQVNTAVGQMDQVTQQNASNAEESSSASEELASQAQELQRSIEELSLIIYGSNARARTKQSNKPDTRYAKAETHNSMLHNMTNKIRKNTPMKKAEPTKKPSVEEVIPLEEKEMAEF